MDGNESRATLGGGRRADDDPTPNVTALVESAITRLDDLRVNDAAHVAELLALRDAHAKDLRLAESARIDAIRAVDVSAVIRAAEVSATQAIALAAQVATSAETLRTQVAAAATASATALAAALEPIQKDIADLRRAQYEAQGTRAQVQEGRAGGASTGMWIGVGVAMFGLLLSVVVVAIMLSSTP